MRICNFLKGITRLFIWAIVIFSLTLVIGKVSAEVNATQLENDCWSKCTEIHKRGVEENCKALYSGCALDVMGCGSRSCSAAYGQYWCDMPGYVGCVNPVVTAYQSCLDNCNVKFRARTSYGEGLFILSNCPSGNCTQNPDGCNCLFDTGVLNCKIQACNAYCVSQGAKGGQWVKYSFKLGRWDACECTDVAATPTPQVKGTLTLEHYPPFPYMEIDERGEIKPAYGPKAGDLIATLKDSTGKGIPQKKVLFFVEPGKNLHGALRSRTTPDADWIRAYSGLNAKMESYIGYGYTNNDGVAKWNYIENGCIYPTAFSEGFIKESIVQGTIKAVVLNESTYRAENTAFVIAEFKYIAKIVDIWGEGQPDSLSGPGQVRVKRPLVRPTFDFKPVEKGFELMPGDIINIDGNTNVQIVWINSDRIIAKVPGEVKFKEGSLPVTNLSIVLMPTAYESGFLTPSEKIRSYLFGYTSNKGIDYLISKSVTLTAIKETYGTVKEYYDLYAELAKAYQTENADLSNTDLIVKIRVHSKIIVESSGGNVKIYNIEGSPDVKTSKGEEKTLQNKEVIIISEDGSTVKVESFDPVKVENEFFAAIPRTPDFNGLLFESRSKSQGSTVQIPLTLKGNRDKIGNMDITLSYDPSVLEAREVIKGSLTTNSLFDFNIQSGTIKISLADKEGFSGNGSVAQIEFKVTGASGSSSPLKILSLSANKADDYKVLAIPTKDGMFTVIGADQCKNDCNGDGKTTALDALCALQMSVGKKTEDLVMDTNGDGKVTSLDARSILKITVGGI